LYSSTSPGVQILVCSLLSGRVSYRDNTPPRYAEPLRNPLLILPLENVGLHAVVLARRLRFGIRLVWEDDMSNHIKGRLVGVVVVMAVFVPTAPAYIHFPPMTLENMCQISTHVRVLRVTDHDKEKGIVLFEDVKTLKGEKSFVKSFKQAIRTDAENVKPILDWIGSEKQAVLFWIEGVQFACGYVFIDNYCYSVDYNRRGDYWQMIRADPQMSACYDGSAEQLQQLTRDILAGKQVKVPVKKPVAPISEEEKKKRFDEVEDILKKNRKK
jgi:hypothetical protein